MKKFEVYVTEEVSTVKTIEAETIKEAKQKAYELYNESPMNFDFVNGFNAKMVVDEVLEVAMDENKIKSHEDKLKEVCKLGGEFSSIIKYNIESILKKQELSKDISQELLDIELKNLKMLKLLELIGTLKFKMKSDKNRFDVFSYIEEYSKKYNNKTKFLGVDTKVSFHNPKNHQLLLNMSVLELEILIDNIFSAVEKRNAKKLEITVEKKQSSLKVIFETGGDELMNALWSPHNRRIVEKLEAKVLMEHTPSEVRLTLEWMLMR